MIPCAYGRLVRPLGIPTSSRYHTFSTASTSYALDERYDMYSRITNAMMTVLVRRSEISTPGTAVAIYLASTGRTSHERKTAEHPTLVTHHFREAHGVCRKSARALPKAVTSMAHSKCGMRQRGVLGTKEPLAVKILRVPRKPPTVVSWWRIPPCVPFRPGIEVEDGNGPIGALYGYPGSVRLAELEVPLKPD